MDIFAYFLHVHGSLLLLLGSLFMNRFDMTESVDTVGLGGHLNVYHPEGMI